MTSLAALTALRNLKFDLQHCYHLTDKHLRHLARLRLTALSLPQLDKVCLGCCRAACIMSARLRMEVQRFLGMLSFRSSDGTPALLRCQFTAHPRNRGQLTG